MVRFRTRWQKNKRLIIIIGVVIIAVLIAIAFLVYIFGWNWTGFNGGYSKITTTRTTHGAIITTEQPPTKTLWDWLQLLAALAIPVVVGFGVAWFTTKQTQTQTKVSEAANKQRHETELEITTDNQREASLQEYIDKMSELFLHEDLLGSDPKKEVREIARIRTLTVLNRLDGKRKGSVLQFLKDSELINQGTTIINLFGANLSGAYLSEAFLHGTRLYYVDLSGANLRQAHLSFIPPNEQYDQEYVEGADLSRANLTGADLSRADLEEVKLRNANLTKANLSGAYLERADLKWANLTEADLSRAKLIGADLSYANLAGADLTNTQLSLSIGLDNAFGANLSKANLKGVTGISIEELEQQASSLKGAIMPEWLSLSSTLCKWLKKDQIFR